MSAELPRVRVEGVGFWAARLPGWNVARAVIRGERPAPEETALRPTPTLLAPTERRRAPDTVAIALEVASQACAAAGREPAALPSVFASTHGDLAISDYMCATLAATPTLLSPVKFHNSVHNAAAGYWSIGVGSYAPYTALSAFESTFAAGLLEAVTQVVCDGQPVLYVAFDIDAKGPLSSMAPSRGLLGAALVLAPLVPIPNEASDGTRGPGVALRIETASNAAGTEGALTVAMTPARSAAANLVSGNALAPCLPFFEALALDRPADVLLQLGRNAGLHVHIS